MRSSMRQSSGGCMTNECTLRRVYKDERPRGKRGPLDRRLGRALKPAIVLAWLLLGVLVKRNGRSSSGP